MICHAGSDHVLVLVFVSQRQRLNATGAVQVDGKPAAGVPADGDGVPCRLCNRLRHYRHIVKLCRLAYQLAHRCQAGASVCTALSWPPPALHGCPAARCPDGHKPKQDAHCAAARISGSAMQNSWGWRLAHTKCTHGASWAGGRVRGQLSHGQLEIGQHQLGVSHAARHGHKQKAQGGSQMCALRRGCRNGVGSLYAASAATVSPAQGIGRFG